MFQVPLRYFLDVVKRNYSVNGIKRVLYEDKGEYVVYYAYPKEDFPMMISVNKSDDRLMRLIDLNLSNLSVQCVLVDEHKSQFDRMITLLEEDKSQPDMVQVK